MLYHVILSQFVAWLMSAMHLKCTNITLNLGRDEAVKGQVSCVVVNELTLEVQPLPGVNQAT